MSTRAKKTAARKRAREQRERDIFRERRRPTVTIAGHVIKLYTAHELNTMWSKSK